MNCPNCRVDIEEFQREAEKRNKKEREEAGRRMEFERVYGESLRPLRKKRKVFNFLLGSLIGCLFVTAAVLPAMFFSHLTFVETITRLSKDVLVIFVSCLFLICFVGLVDLVLSDKSKKERKLWDEFCRLHLIE